MGRRHAGLDVFDLEALNEYRRCIALPGTAGGICGDYRASAGIDLEHDLTDQEADRRLAMPLRLLWGAHGTVGKCFGVLGEWRKVADDVSRGEVDCGHYVAEEQPGHVIVVMRDAYARAASGQ